MMAWQAIPEIMKLLCNIEPNMGDNQKNNAEHHHGKVDWGIVSKLQCFTGKLSEGYFFTIIYVYYKYFSNTVNMFDTLLEGEVST